MNLPISFFPKIHPPTHVHRKTYTHKETHTPTKHTHAHTHTHTQKHIHPQNTHNTHTCITQRTYTHEHNTQLCLSLFHTHIHTQHHTHAPQTQTHFTSFLIVYFSIGSSIHKSKFINSRNSLNTRKKIVNCFFFFFALIHEFTNCIRDFRYFFE